MSLRAQGGTLRSVSGKPRNKFVYVDGDTLMFDGEPFRFCGPNNLDLIGNWSGVGRTEAQIDTYFALWPPNTVHRIKPLEENSQIWDSYVSPYEQLTIVVRSAERYQQKLICSLMDGISTSAYYLNRAWFQGGYTGTLAAHAWAGPDYGTHTSNYWNWITTVCTAFKDSPAIAVWEIMNEPDNASPATGVTQAEMKAFFAAASTHIKAADPNHLVSPGCAAPQQAWNNSVAKYADIHNVPNVDLVSAHEYQWAFNGWIGSDIVENTIAAAALIGKPCYIGESGVGPGSSGTTTLATRLTIFKRKLDIYFGKVQEPTHTPSAWTAPVSGVNYWQLLPAADSGVTNGTVSAPEYFSSDPMESPNGMVDMLRTYDPWGPRVNQFEDDFTTKNTSLWTWENANASVVGGRLNLIPQTSIYSGGGKTLRGSSATVEMVSTCAVGNGTTQCGLKIATSDFSQNFQLYWSNGQLYFHENAGTPSETSVAYSNTTHRWLRIREADGTVYWETSPTALDGSWTVRRSKTWAITQVTDLVMQLFGSFYGTEPAPGTAVFDNFVLV